jgi:general secretion pathway protein F
MIGFIVGLFYVIKRIRRTKPEIFDSFLLKVSLSRSLYISRFTRIFGFLLSGGIPLLRSLDLAAKSTGNTVLRSTLHDAAEKISEGGGVAASLSKLPPVLRQMIATGEKTGELPKLLDRAADAYESDFSKKVNFMLSLLEPLMIIIMGGIVGFIVLSVLLPIFQMNQLIK